MHNALDKNPDQVPAQELPSRAAPSACDASPYPTVQPQESYLEEGREGEDPQEKKKKKKHLWKADWQLHKQ